MGESRFVVEIDRLRGFIIVIVVVSHALVVAKGTVLGSALYEATRGATWPFVFIAGFLFAHLRERYSWAGYTKSKVQNVITPYVIIVTLLLVSGLSNPKVSLAPAQHYLLGYPASAPMWFIPMIVLFYIGFPFYRSLCKFPRTLLAATAISFAVAAAMGRPHFNAGPLLNFLYFQSAWLFGMAWQVHREAFDTFVSRYYALIILAFAIGINISAGDDAFAQRGQIFMWAPFTTLLVPAMKTDTPLDPIWSWLASRSFGIFFLHGIATDQMIVAIGGTNNAILALVFGAGLTFACGLVVDGIKKIAGNRSRLLVGA